jgi:hypothetical protein
MPRIEPGALLACALTVLLTQGLACSGPQPSPTASPVAHPTEPTAAPSPGLVESVAAASAQPVSTPAPVRPAAHAHNDQTTPEYFVGRLGDPAQRPMAVRRLTQFFEDAMTRADKDRADEKVKALLDLVVPPLTDLYVNSADTDKQTALEMIRLLADTHDLRAKPAWIKAIAQYQPNEPAAPLGYVARAIVASGVKDPGVDEALIRTFVRFEAGSRQGSLVYVEFKKALTAVSSPTWESVLIARLARPMGKLTTKDRGNDKKIADYRNEQFWQVTAAEILGNLRAKAAARPLLLAVLDPHKADVAATAIVALVKIGPDAMPLLVRALRGADADIESRARKSEGDATKGRAQVARTAALVIGTLGRRDGVAPLLRELNRPGYDAITRAVLARELTKCPATPASLQMVVKVFEGTSSSVIIPPGHEAKYVLGESLASFHDPSIVPRMIRHLDGLSADPEAEGARTSAIATLIKVMRRNQVSQVEGALHRWAPTSNEMRLEKKAFARSKDVVLACREDVSCYLTKVASPQAQEKREQFIGIKAAYMIGVLGNAHTRAEILKRLPSISNAAIRFTLGMTLDHLTPDGDAATERGLEAILEENRRSGDRHRIMGDAPLRQVLFRMKARRR